MVPAGRRGAGAAAVAAPAVAGVPYLCLVEILKRDPRDAQSQFLHDCAQRPAVVAERATWRPDWTFTRQFFRGPSRAEVSGRQSGRRAQQTRLVAQGLPNCDAGLAVLRELGPVTAYRRIEIEFTAFGEDRQAERGDAFGRRGQSDDAVARQLESAHEINNWFAAPVHGELAAVASTSTQELIEFVGDRGESRVHVTLSVAGNWLSLSHPLHPRPYLPAITDSAGRGSSVSLSANGSQTRPRAMRRAVRPNVTEVTVEWCSAGLVSLAGPISTDTRTTPRLVPMRIWPPCCDRRR